MNIVQPSYEILGIFPGEEDCLQWLERIGRTCYKSEDKITAESAPKFVRSILKLDRMFNLHKKLCQLFDDCASETLAHERMDPSFIIHMAGKAGQAVQEMLNDPPHESVIEHSMMTVRFIFDRGISHEMVRHRLCAFSQESTRYCNYNKGGQGINVIDPGATLFQGDSVYHQARLVDWEQAMRYAEMGYQELIDGGAKPQEARSVLPNSLKTEIVVTANFREWRHIFRLRTSKKAHPQIREVMVPLLKELKAKPNLGLLFEDIEVQE
jgi:thymidylate synthase (FAD)